MRVGVMGAGGVGAYAGAMLQRQGHEVTYIARGDHLAAMQRRGLEVRWGADTIFRGPVHAIATPAEVEGGVDLVLFTVKGYDTVPAAQALRTIMGEQTAVLTLQNGIDSVEALTAILGADHVLAGTASFTCHIVAPGVVERISPACSVTVCEATGGTSPRVEAVAAAFNAAGIDAVVTLESRRAAWEKFIRVAPRHCLENTCLAPIRDVVRVPEGEVLARAALAELVAVARASGVPFPDNAVDAQLAGFAASLGAKGSMQVDFERGHQAEVEELPGALVRLGRQLGVPTPIFDVLYGILKVRDQTSRRL